tara:strand:+ start:6633 stop:7526 length:894 start_codon:yes stop_codon:yes gene_type:complete
MDNKKEGKVGLEFYCKLCNVNCRDSYNLKKHFDTKKHKWITMDNKKEGSEFICECGKYYKYNSGLSKHKKNCNYNQPVCQETQKSGFSEELIFKLLEKLEEKDKKLEEKDKHIELVVKENSELTKTIINSNLGGHHNNTINNNQRFNINMFLKEECKDAINMTDFIKSIHVSFEQLDYTKVNGLEKGITKILMDNINKLGKFERPVHCTDIKRETLYIKHDNNWERDHDQIRIKTAIKQMACKPYVPLQEWISQNPDFKEIDDKQDYVANVLSTIGKPTDNIDKKIIKNVCVSTFIK